MKVTSMVSSKGNKVANQFIITKDDNTEYFQSYDSIIAMKMRNSKGTAILLDEKTWDYSKTTGKYRNIFLGENKAITQKKIDSGEYKLTQLNS